MKYILAIVLLLVVATMFFIFRPQPVYRAGMVEPAPSGNSVEDKPAEDTEQLQADLRRAAMEAEFDGLARARRDLNQKLNTLKVVLWDVQLPGAESDAITETMKKGYAMLKSPKLLGAYFSVEQISTERARIQYIYDQLQQIEDKYRSQGEHQ